VLLNIVADRTISRSHFDIYTICLPELLINITLGE